MEVREDVGAYALSNLSGSLTEMLESIYSNLRYISSTCIVTDSEQFKVYAELELRRLIERKALTACFTADDYSEFVASIMDWLHRIPF